MQHTSEDIPLGVQKKGRCWACLSTPVDRQPAPKKARETGKLSVIWSNLGKMETTERGTRKPGGEGQPVAAAAREMALSAQTALRLWHDRDTKLFSRLKTMFKQHEVTSQW